MEQASLLYVTTGSIEEAQKIAGALVEAHQVACANILPNMQSVYRWKGEVAHDDEVVLILKTRTALVDKVIERVKELHSYECPCVLALPVQTGNVAFLEWIVAETAAAR